MLDIFSDNKNGANKQGLILARTRYLEQVEPFVGGSQDRLAYAEPEIQRIIKECAEVAKADPVFIESHLRESIAAGMEAVTKPKKQKLPFNTDKAVAEKGYGGGPGSPPAKYDPAKVNPQPDASSDLSYHAGPLLEDEIRDPDLVHDLGKDSFDGKNKTNFASIQKHSPYGVPKSKGGDSPANDSKMEDCVDKVMKEGHTKESAIRICKASMFGDKKACVRCDCEIEDGIVCEKCSSELVKKANPLINQAPLPGMPAGSPQNVCPHCSTPMQPGSPNCPTCGYALNALNPQTPGMGQTLNPSAYAAVKEALLPENSDFPGNAPQPQAPVQPPQQQFGEEPIRVDQGLSASPRDRFENVVSDLANRAAAKQFSQPTDEEISMIAQHYGLDPEDVRQNLKVVAKFGQTHAVNGELFGDDNTENMSEVDLGGMGGRVSSHQAEVPLQMAISQVAKDLGIEDNLVYSEVKDSYGNQDLPQQFRTAISGDHRFYLPANMVGVSNPEQQPYEPDQSQPTNDMQVQPAS